MWRYPFDHFALDLGEGGFAFSLSILAVNANNAPRKILATYWQGATLQGAKIILAFGSPVDPRTSQLHHVQGWARHRYFWHAPPYYGGDRYLAPAQLTREEYFPDWDTISLRLQHHGKSRLASQNNFGNLKLVRTVIGWSNVALQIQIQVHLGIGSTANI